MGYKKKQQNSTQKMKWTDKEKDLLRKLEPRFASKKWKEISKEFRNRGFIRTEVECREKWVNQLNPSIKKTEWDADELKILFETFKQNGSHWSLIQKLLAGRTQNMIKNKFYSLLRNIVRFILRSFQQNAEQTRKILNCLSSQYLQNLYCGLEEFAFLGRMLVDNFRKMSYQLDKKLFKELLIKNEEKFKTTYELIKKEVQLQKVQRDESPQIQGPSEQDNGESVPVDQLRPIPNAVKIEERLPQPPMYDYPAYFPTYDPYPYYPMAYNPYFPYFHWPSLENQYPNITYR